MSSRRLRPTHLRRILVPAAVVTLAASFVGAPVAAVGPTPSISAWVVVRGAVTLGATVTPGPMDQGNSAGGTNTITRTGAGRYTVVLGDLGTANGTVLVTAQNTEARWCSVLSWGLVGDDVSVQVACTNAAGVGANARLVLTYVAGTGGHGTSAARLAYPFSDDPTTSGTPDEDRQYTSAGTTISLTRTAAGRYTVTLPAMGVSGGNVQLTAWNGPATCRATSWAAAGADEVIQVRCATPAGVDTDSDFDLLFLSRVGPEGFGGGPSAYLVGNKPKAASYTPDAAFRFNSKGKTMSILRGSVGNYTVVLTGMPAGGAAIVTAQGTGSTHCQLSSLGTQLPMKAIVRCFSASGAPADSRFSLAYTK